MVNVRQALVRYYNYTHSRFPLVPLALHCGLAALVLATISVSDPVASLWNGLIYLLFLLHMRVLDEYKDKSFDDHNYPDRPVQAGLVTLQELKRIGWVNFGLMALLVLAQWPPAGWLIFIFAIGYSALMYREFFIPRFWERSPAQYLLSHQVVLLILFLGFLSRELGQAPPIRMLAAILFVYATVLIIELGRKVNRRYDPRGRETTDTYAFVWGSRLTLNLISLAGAFAFLVAWWAGLIAAQGFFLGVGLYAAYYAASLLFEKTLTMHSREITFLVSLLQLLVYLVFQP